MNPSLRFSEWLLSLSLILVLASFVVIAKVQSYRSRGDVPLRVSSVSVNISGHVSKPGAYSVDAGTPLKEVFVLAKPKRYANLELFDLDQPAVDSVHYIVEPLTELTLWVEGACIEKELKVPLGARISDLKGMISLDNDADLTIFKKRRLLENREKLHIKRHHRT